MTQRTADVGHRGTVILAGGRVIDPSQHLDEVTDVAIVDGKIDSIGRNLAENRKRPGAEGAAENDVQGAAGNSAEGAAGNSVIDCAGLIVAPGFIDVHCHL